MADVSFNSLLNGTAPAGQSILSSLTGSPGKPVAEQQTAKGGATTAPPTQTSTGANSSATSSSTANTAQPNAAKPGTSIKESKEVSAGTAQSANQMLANVDATIAKYQGANGKPPANHQERTKAVAQIADGLKGAEKTAFLEKIQSEGKAFGMNFGQKSIDDKSAFSKLDGEHQAVNRQLQEEAKTGNKAGETTKMVPNGRLGMTPQAQKKEATPQGVATTKGMSDDVADLLTRVNQQTAEETRAMVAGWDGEGNGKISAAEVTVNNAAGVSTWKDMSQVTKAKRESSVEDMTTMLRQKAAAYGAQMKSEASSTSAS